MFIISPMSANNNSYIIDALSDNDDVKTRQIISTNIKFDCKIKSYISDFVYVVYAKSLNLYEIINIFENRMKIIKKISENNYDWSCTNTIIFLNINNIKKLNYDFQYLYDFVYQLNYDNAGKKNIYNNHLILLHKDNDKIYVVNNIIITHKNFIRKLLNIDLISQDIDKIIKDIKTTSDLTDTNNYVMEYIRLLLLNIILPQTYQNFQDNVKKQFEDWATKINNHNSIKDQAIKIIGNICIIDNYKKGSYEQTKDPIYEITGNNRVKGTVFINKNGKEKLFDYVGYSK